MANKTDIVTGVAVLGCSALGAYGIKTTGSTASATDSLGATAFPTAIIALLCLCGVLLIIQGMKKSDVRQYWPSRPVLCKTLGNIVLFLLYAGLVMILGEWFIQTDVELLQQNMGFGIGTFIYLMAAFYLNGRRRLWEMLLVAVLVPASIILLFNKMFQIALP